MQNWKTIGSRIQLSVIVAALFTVLGITSCGGGTSPANQNQDNQDNPAHPPSNSNLMGINIATPLYWEEDRLYTDVMRMSDNFTGGTVGTDSWPTTDFSVLVWNDMANMHGTYVLSYTGQASVLASAGNLSAISYDSENNTSTGTLQFTDASSSALSLTFTGTKRTSGSASGTGITMIKLMRPTAPGSSTSYPTTTLFSAPIKALISKFSVIRFMDFLATNWSVQSNWTDRPLPSWPSFQRYPTGTYGGWQGYGGPWEHVILLSNETGKDAWINIPLHATDAYVLNVARMFAYGSNGINPYTSSQANPIYPPLNANLNIYVEYSNEVWNGGFQQFDDNCNAASDELVSTAGNSPLNWDGLWNGAISTSGTWNWTFCDRQTTKRTVEISNIFRSVFGSKMGSRIRPVLMSQFTNSGATLFNQMQMMLDYYDNMASSSGVALPTPHAPNYYLYGAGGTGYYSPASVVSTLDAFFADPGMTPTGVITTPYGPFTMTSWFQDDTKLAAAMGLKRIAYEGGPDLGYTNYVHQTPAIVQAAVNDSRMTTAIVNMHNAWSNNGGDLFVYYRSSGDHQWSFAQDVYSLSTKKLMAIDALNAADRAPLTFGTAVPGSIAGSAADTCSTGWGCTSNSFTANGANNVWASYSFRSTASANWTANLSVTSASSASVAVYVDGNLVATQATTAGTHPLAFNAGTIGAGLHGVIVRAVAGSFSIESVAVALN
jgi:hypothetical protein